MHIALIPGHGHKRKSGGGLKWDPGATYDGVEEANVVRLVADACVRLGGRRVSVHDTSRTGVGTYSERRNAAHDAIGEGPGVIVHLHCNAGKGSYLMSMHDHRSALGKSRASDWAAAADSVLRPLFDFDPKERVQPTQNGDWTKRGHNLLAPSYSTTPAGVCAVLIEVGFIDTDAHSKLWTPDGIEAQARCILLAFRG